MNVGYLILAFFLGFGFGLLLSEFIDAYYDYCDRGEAGDGQERLPS